MQAPYTDHPAQAFAVAQLGTGVLLTLAASRPLLRFGRTTCATWLTSVWLLVLAPELADLLHVTKLSFLPWALVLQLAALLAARKYRLVAAAAPVFAVILWARVISIDHDWELLCAGLISAGYVLGLLCPPWGAAAAPRDPKPADRRWAITDRRQDLYLFLLGLVAGVVIAQYVLLRGVDGSDEWGYTYQAAVYAKGHLYGKVPECLPSFRNFWVFWRGDRMFAQYQPGWPLFLAPLVRLGMVWIGGPLSLGLFAMCIGRLARRALRLVHPGDDAGSGQRAAWVAGLALLASTTILINGGSRFPHPIICALFCAIVETSWVLRERTTAKSAVGPGLLLGALTGYLALVRIPEAALLGMGPGVYLVICAIRKKTHWIAIPCALAATIPSLVFLLWSAHRQVGGWGVLPYMLGKEFYPQFPLKFSIPSASLWKWSLPLAWGAYCWWPLCPALGLAGMMLLTRARDARRAAFTVGISVILNGIFYGLIEFGRGGDFGYGPRYQMAVVVPIALGTAVFVDYLVRDLGAKARRLWIGACAITVCVGFVLLGRNLFGFAHQTLLHTTVIDRNIAKSDIHHAIVIAGRGTGFPYGPFDVTHNYPIDLYDPDVIVANGYKPACLVEQYPDRALYVALPAEDGQLRFQRVTVDGHQ